MMKLQQREGAKRNYGTKTREEENSARPGLLCKQQQKLGRGGEGGGIVVGSGLLQELVGLSLSSSLAESALSAGRRRGKAITSRMDVAPVFGFSEE